MKIDVRVVEDLIELGESGRPGIPESLLDVSIAAERLMRGIEPWYEVGEKLTEARLKAIIQGLILYCRASGFSGGSVSPVIQLYRKYAERFPQNEIPLNKWIFENRLTKSLPTKVGRFVEATESGPGQAEAC